MVSLTALLLQATGIRFCGMSGSAWACTTKDPSLVCAARETVLKILQQSRATGRTSVSSAPKALLFKTEDKTSESELEKAIEELSTKLKHWGADVRGQVLQANMPNCQVVECAECCMK